MLRPGAVRTLADDWPLSPPKADDPPETRGEAEPAVTPLAPVQQATKVEPIINLKTVKALGPVHRTDAESV
jgi:hypothetical protein